MQGIELDAESWSLSFLGLDHPFFNLTPEIIIHTWIIIFILLALVVPIRWLLKNTVVPRFLALYFFETFSDLCTQTLGFFSFNHIAFVTSIFIFILLCNCISVIPWLEEPTKDLNTTLALGIITFVYTQYYSIKAHGIAQYIKEYFSPFFLMFPLHVLGKLATVISISFRLFGNIYGGYIISSIYHAAIHGSLVYELFGLLSGSNLLIIGFFGVFEGGLQAFVFCMLTLTYLALAIQTEQGEHA